ncbi:hypothetical protein ABZZ80_13940 [Streptomyces sp. NPDC006356]
MRFALVYAYDPVQTGPGHGEIDEWVELDAALKAGGNFVHESGFHPAGRHGPSWFGTDRLRCGPAL